MKYTSLPQTRVPETTEDKSDNVRYLMQRVLPKFNDLNLGIILICSYIITEFGSVIGLYRFLNFQFKLPFIIASTTIAYAVFLFVTRQVNLKSGFAKIFTIICLFILGYTLLATRLPDIRLNLLKSFSFYLSAYFVCIASIRRLSQFILVIDVWLASILFSSFHGIMQGGLVWGNKYFRDENELALLVAMALPYSFIFLLSHKSKLKRLYYLTCIAFYTGVNIVANSRGGMLSIAAAIFFIWLILDKKIRNFFILMFLVLVSLHFAPPQFFKEMGTIKQGTEESTAESRIYFWRKGMEMFYSHPFFGVGPGNYPYFFPQYERGERYYLPTRRPIHSFPIQWIAEMGIVGFTLLFLLQIMLWKNWLVFKVYKSKMISQEDPLDITVLANFSHAVAIAQIVFWVGGLFLSLMQYPFYWFMIYFSDVLRRIIERRIEDHTENNSPTFL